MSRLKHRFSPEHEGFPRTRLSDRLSMLIGAILGLVSGSALHADEVVIVPMLEVIASRLTEPEAHASRRLARIGREEIEQRQPRSVIELLRGIAGVDATSLGGPGGLTFLSIRGGDPNFTLFLIDGVKVNDPTNSRGGGFDLNAIDPATIERIEIHAGSLSSVHGSDALGGLVSITTRRHDASGKDPGLQIESGVGTQGERHLNAFLSSSSSKDLTWAVSAAGRDAGNTVAGDRLTSRQLTTRLNSKLTSTTQASVQLNLGAGDSASFPEDSGGPRLASIQSTETREFLHWLTSAELTHQITTDWSVRSSASLASTRADSANPGIAQGALTGIPALISKSRFLRKDADIALHGTPFLGLDLVVGSSISHESGGSDDLIDVGFPLATRFDLQRTTLAGFAEMSWSPVPVAGISAGIRHDKPNSIDGESTANVSAWFWTDPTDTRLSMA